MHVASSSVLHHQPNDGHAESKDQSESRGDIHHQLLRRDFLVVVLVRPTSSCIPSGNAITERLDTPPLRELGVEFLFLDDDRRAGVRGVEYLLPAGSRGKLHEGRIVVFTPSFDLTGVS